MPVQPSAPVSIVFLVHSGGQAIDPDSLPTAVLYRNGVATSVTVTIASLTPTGEHSASFDAGAWSPGDVLQLVATAVLNTEPYTNVVWADTISAGETDWSTTEREQIRYRLGVDGDKSQPTQGGPQFPVTVSPSSIIQLNDPTPDEAGHFYLTQRDDYVDAGEVQPIGPIRIETEMDLLPTSNAPTLRFGATQSLGRKLGDVHIVGTAHAVAVAGESNQYDIFVAVPAAELDKPAGDYRWDVESVWPPSDLVRTVINGTFTLRSSMGDHEARAAAAE